MVTQDEFRRIKIETAKKCMEIMESINAAYLQTVNETVYSPMVMQICLVNEEINNRCKQTEQKKEEILEIARSSYYCSLLFLLDEINMPKSMILTKFNHHQPDLLMMY